MGSELRCEVDSSRTISTTDDTDRTSLPVVEAESQRNKGLTTVKLPSGLKHLGTDAFFYCSALETIELPASLEKIEPFAFCAAGLKSIVIPENETLTELPQFMFHQCPNLKEVVIPASITTIADNCFSECPADLTLKVASGSYAEQFAQENGLNYEAV